MRRTTAVLAAGFLAASAVAAGPASSQSSADHEIEMQLGDTATVAGGVPQGVNPDYFGNAGDGGVCSHDVDTYCEQVLIKVSNPFEEENAKKGRERANLDLHLTPTNPVSDFDLVLYESDADGTTGAEIGRSGQTPVADNPESSETINAIVTTTADETDVWVIAHIVYFAAASDYSLDVSFSQ